ncbi:MAG: hypothetical protein FJY55_02745 [Betaproteobacteria bacterium]|nr:hypothetical protein [Betaproteobacteria bacterium]
MANKSYSSRNALCLRLPVGRGHPKKTARTLGRSTRAQTHAPEFERARVLGIQHQTAARAAATLSRILVFSKEPPPQARRAHARCSHRALRTMAIALFREHFLQVQLVEPNAQDFRAVEFRRETGMRASGIYPQVLWINM